MTKGTYVPPHLHQTVLDVHVERLADIYAQAALDAAGGLNAQQALLEELSSVVDEVLSKYPDVEKVFDSALVSKDDKLGLVDRLFGGRLSSTAIHVMKVMARHGRLGQLRQVVLASRRLWTERSDKMAVHLQLACEADDALRAEILSVLADTLKTHPLVSVEVNPDLIAGFVARVGDRVYDASVRTSLEHTRQAMVERSVEAILHHTSQFRNGAPRAADA